MVIPLSSSSHLACSNQYHSVPRRVGETGNSDRQIRNLVQQLFLKKHTPLDGAVIVRRMKAKCSGRTVSEARMDRLSDIEILLLARMVVFWMILNVPTATCARFLCNTETQRGVYRLWFLCGECKFHQRVQLSGKTKHFLDRASG
jgi:hypothetical protein